MRLNEARGHVFYAKYSQLLLGGMTTAKCSITVTSGSVIRKDARNSHFALELKTLVQSAMFQPCNLFRENKLDEIGFTSES